MKTINELTGDIWNSLFIGESVKVLRGSRYVNATVADKDYHRYRHLINGCEYFVCRCLLQVDGRFFELTWEMKIPPDKQQNIKIVPKKWNREIEYELGGV